MNPTRIVRMQLITHEWAFVENVKHVEFGNEMLTDLHQKCRARYSAFSESPKRSCSFPPHLLLLVAGRVLEQPRRQINAAA
jgi:hypothetical protein